MALQQLTKTQVDRRAEAMAAMPYGLYVVGSADIDGEPNAMIACWVMQVSFEPRQVAVSIENDARTLGYIRNRGAFSVNILDVDDGAHIAHKVVMPAEGRKVEGRSHEVINHKLEGLDYQVHESGVPVLSRSLGWYTCTVRQMVPVGGHTLVIGEVTDAMMSDQGSETLLERDLGWGYAG